MEAPLIWIGAAFAAAPVPTVEGNVTLGSRTAQLAMTSEPMLGWSVRDEPRLPAPAPVVGLSALVPVQLVGAGGAWGFGLEAGTRKAWWLQHPVEVRQWDARLTGALVLVPRAYQREVSRLRAYAEVRAGLAIGWTVPAGAPALVTAGPCGAVGGGIVLPTWPRTMVGGRLVGVPDRSRYDYAMVIERRVTRILVDPGYVGLDLVAGVGFR